MSPSTALALAGALLVAVTVIGLLWRRRDGRARAGDGALVAASDLPAALGARATLVQFSTELCARCPQVRRLLAATASALPGVEHVEVDLTHRADLASRYRVLQTPTTLVVDAGGRIRSRFNGVPRPADVEAALAALPEHQESPG